METLKIRISEVEGMTIKIATEYTPITFNKLYEQLFTVAKSMPDVHIQSTRLGTGEGIKTTPERFTAIHWKDDKENKKVLKIWETEGKDALVEWFKEEKDVVLNEHELSMLSGLIGGFKTKYRRLEDD